MGSVEQPRSATLMAPAAGILPDNGTETGFRSTSARRSPMDWRDGMQLEYFVRFQHVAQVDRYRLPQL